MQITLTATCSCGATGTATRETPWPTVARTLDSLAAIATNAAFAACTCGEDASARTATDPEDSGPIDAGEG